MSSYGHKCREIVYDAYQISWVVDFKYSGSRLRYPRQFSRITDMKGAKKFCKKWDVKQPEGVKDGR